MVEEESTAVQMELIMKTVVKMVALENFAAVRKLLNS